MMSNQILAPEIHLKKGFEMSERQIWSVFEAAHFGCWEGSWFRISRGVLLFNLCTPLSAPVWVPSSLRWGKLGSDSIHCGPQGMLGCRTQNQSL